MDKLVYLYELDSVCNSKEEIIIGQQAMFEEIVVNGNVVVLSFNQLVDSQAFLFGIRDDKNYRQVMKLFFNGSIRISKYSSAQTASEYLQNSIEKCMLDKENTNKNKGSYIFSGVPVLNSEKELLKELYRALRYADIDALDAFLIHYPDKEDRVVYLKKYVQLILSLNNIEDAYIPKKKEINFKFIDYINEIILDKIYTFFEERAELQIIFKNSIKILYKIKDSIPKDRINNRTEWINKLNEFNEFPETCMAEAIVNLCYNYSVEESILGVSRHYDVRRKEQFFEDFDRRLLQYWREYEEGIHILHKGDTNKILMDDILLPQWETAARITDVRKKYGWEFRVQDVPLLYEENYQEERKCWKKERRKALRRNLKSALFYSILFLIINVVIGYAQEFFEDNIEMKGDVLSRIIGSIIAIFIFTLLFGVMASIINSIFKLPDILESVKNIGKSVIDMYRVFESLKNKEYKAQHGDRNMSDSKNMEWKKYKQLVIDRPDDFKDNGNIHIVLDENIVRKFEVEHHKIIGVVYESKYHIMVVDLVYEVEGQYYAYERILPAVEKEAVAVIPFHNGNVVLLQQYRHALRGYQYAIPRGFAEKKLSISDNVKKEIKEELSADVFSCDFCGKIEPDSGLTGKTVYVYSCNISDYKTKKQYEGISDTVELSFEEMELWISKRRITDGFTLAAYSLLKSRGPKKQ